MKSRSRIHRDKLLVTFCSVIGVTLKVCIILPLDGIFLPNNNGKFFHLPPRIIDPISYLFKNTIKIRTRKVDFHGTCLAVEPDDHYIVSELPNNQ